MLKVVQDSEEFSQGRGAAGESLLDEIVRDGARRMLAVALAGRDGAWWSATVPTSRGR